MIGQIYICIILLKIYSDMFIFKLRQAAHRHRLCVAGVLMTSDDVLMTNLNQDDGDHFPSGAPSARLPAMA